MSDVKHYLLKQRGLIAVVRNLSASAAILCCSMNVFASCEYIINSEWNTGFTASIKITNSTTSAINSWAVAWQYSANKITSSWNATVTGSNPYSAAGLNWNSNIQPGQSVSFGFQGDKNSSLAEKPVITGSACDSAVLSSSSSITSSSSVAVSTSSAVTSSSSSKSSASSNSSSTSFSSAKSSLRSSSIASSAVSSNTSTSTSSIATNQQCNWYGTLYPLCVTTATGWGYENNKSCIAAVTCSAQPAPYGIVGVASSSSIKSSSSSLVSSVASSSKSSSSSSKSSSSSTSTSSSSSKASSSSVSSVSAGILFQENFENGVVNTQPAGWDNFIAWNYNTTNSNANSTYAVIESGKAYSGTKAIHFKGSLAQIVHKLPAGIQRLHLRAYVNLSKKLGNDATDNHEHIMGIKKTQDANDEIRVGQIKGVLGTNHVPSDNIAPKMDKWYGGTELSPNTWYCVETAMYADTAYDELYMWVDGNLVHSITSANDWNNGSLPADWLSDKFNYVMFGFHSFSGNTADVWMDDVVVSTQPIGCAIN